jgi:hypothetical protein
MYGEDTYYTKSALARYLGLLFWRGSGNMDDARIDWEEIQQAFDASPAIYTNPIPAELAAKDGICDELDIPRGMARLNVLGFTGLSSYKTAINLNIAMYSYLLDYTGFEDEYSNTNDLTVAPIKIAAFRSSPVDSIEIRFDDGQSFNLSLLENIGTVVQEVYESREYRRTTISRAAYMAGLIKDTIAASYGAPFKGYPLLVWTTRGQLKQDEGRRQLIEERIEKDNRIHDLRMGRYFPGKAYSGGINLAPGVYSFTVNYSGGGKIIHSERFENVAVEAGKLNLIETYNLEHTERVLPGNFKNEIKFSDFPGRLPAPTGLTLTTEMFGDTNIGDKLEWDPVPGAARYAVYWADSLNKVYILSQIVNGTSCYQKQGASFKVVAIGPDGFSLPSQAASH